MTMNSDKSASFFKTFWQDRSIKARLVGGFLLVILIVGFASIVVGIRLINTRVYDQAYDAIRGHMGSAMSIFNSDLEIMKLKAEKLAATQDILHAVKNREFTRMNQLETADYGDMIIITDTAGTVLYRFHNPVRHGDLLTDDTIINQVLQNGKPLAATAVLSEKRLRHEGSDIAEQACIDIKDTPLARPSRKTDEKKGLVFQATAPVYIDGVLAGTVTCMQLLNNNFEFVDRIRSIIFSGSKSFNPTDGTATIFMDDIRISTNVTLENGKRAVGTTMSEPVYDNIYKKQSNWIDRAFVVNKWYITAYTPIRDISHEVVGVLYVGLKESIFISTRNQALAIMGSVILGAIIFALLLAFFLVRDIIMPVRSLAQASKGIAAGLYRKMPGISGTNEMSQLASAFNTMVDAIKERDTILKEHTEKKIFQMQKLASLGRLSSGIAHELNNPLTGILTYASLLKENPGTGDFHGDLDIIIRETQRCKSIVREILNLARETNLEKEEADLNRIIDEILIILERSKQFKTISIIRQYDSKLPPLLIDINQMKSVISNLMINAADAMPDGGTIEVATSHIKNENLVRFSVSDTGVGIPEEDMDKIFDPFYTTKEIGKGTGLGLSVTWGIINNHAGTISIDSQLNKGTVFTIDLPLNASRKNELTETEGTIS